MTIRVLFGYSGIMETEIGEKIKVVSLFENGGMKPIIFSWRKRIYKILRVVFSYSKSIGKDHFFYFSIETEGGEFEISFNREKSWWEIEKVF